MKIKRTIYSLLFLSIFLIKMVISVAPIYFSLYDSKKIASVILQLEIEDHSEKSNSNDIDQENFTKEFATAFDWHVFVPSFRYIAVQQYLYDDSMAVRSFYPSVPTPPPNC